ncbi:MAG: efflux transporter outer membrane subunit [Denitromonas halophila]|nr:MAG: efflux transporter outer membrane subunit [Denitromonas halophila]TVT75004.1 MAG: efflux transporter outer membrane subunit [Denitromonas halophila]
MRCSRKFAFTMTSPTKNWSLKRKPTARGTAMTKPLTRLAPLLTALVLSACAVGPVYEAPAIALPGQFEAAPSSATLATQLGDAWWLHYQDPVLDQLMAEALTHNADVQLAAARLEEARARAGIADADRYPTVSASAGSNRIRSSEQGIATDPRTYNLHTLGLSASYELDLWGRYRQASEAARADLLGAVAARRTVALSLSAELATRYFDLQAADERLRVLQQTLSARKNTAALLRQRMDAGSASQFDVLQADAAVAQVESDLATTLSAQQSTEAALAVLLGHSPRAIFEETLTRGAKTDTAVVVPAGLPAELLRRRPDLIEAEQALVAATARIGEAQAQRLPAIALTAALGRESTDLSNLLDANAGVFSLAASLTQPIWDAGRLKRNVDIAEARATQARLRYTQAVAGAFADVRRALAAQRGATDSRAAQATRVEALQTALDQSQQRFDAGLVSRLEVLDTERSLLDAQVALANASAAQKTAIADLFRALGGGWQTPTEAAATAQ